MQIEKLEEAFFGRELLAKESKTLEINLRLHPNIEKRNAFFESKNTIQCNRCGATDYHLRIPAPCFCQKNCFYCGNCLNMGKIRRCSTLYYLPEKEKKFRTIEESILVWEGTLSPQQETASKDIIETFEKKETRLIWAVAGAGKTEMIFAGIERALKTGNRVCIASPRVDVCLELAPRLKRAFPKTSTVLLYGDSEDDYCHTQLVIATTHQLLRFKEAFDLLIIDEIDAFPFTVDNTLRFAVEKARKKVSSLIYLSATPSSKMQKQIQERQLPASILPARYHGHALPQPKCVWLNENSGSQKSKRKLFRYVQLFFQRKRRMLLFMPTIKEMLAFEEELKKAYPKMNIASASSEDPHRKEHVLAMRKEELDLLLTTTILERGVTFIDIDVLVYRAENRIFSSSALVQIAGRAGRHQDFPKGEVLFFHHGKSRNMKQAIKQIKQMNHLAKKKGIVTTLNSTCLLCNRGLLENINVSYFFAFRKDEKDCLCQECRSKFRLLRQKSTCKGCGRIEEATYCFDCTRWKRTEPDSLINHKALCEYDDWMKEWIEQFKYRGDYRLGKVFSIELKKSLSKKIASGSVIVPLPISVESYQNRGFNQVEALLDFAGIPYCSLLENKSVEKKQSTKNREERMDTQQPFKWNQNEKVELDKLKEKSIILVDDIYTTGRTLLHAKKILVDAGMSLEKSLSIAR